MAGPASAVWPLQVAVDIAFSGDAALQTEMGGTVGAPKVYSGLAPQGTVLPYIVLGASFETGRDFFQRRGHEGTETFRISAANKAVATAIYGHVKRLLDGPLLALDGHTIVLGRTEWVTDFVDPDGVTFQAVIRYRTRSTVAA